MPSKLRVLDRRRFLQATAAGAGLGLFGSCGEQAGPTPEPAAKTATLPKPSPRFENIERYVAVDNVCAWPNLTLATDGTIFALIYNQPSHLQMIGDVDCWASTDGGVFWEKRGTAVPHEPKTARANIAAGLANNGQLVVLCSGWGYAPTLRDRRLPPWVSRSSDGGRTWKVDKSKAAIEFPEGADYEDRGEKMFKPFGDIVRMGGNKLAASFYTDYGTVWMLFSEDDGKTWGNAAVISDDHRGETAILRLRADRWLVASRIERGPDEKTPRLGLELFVSADEGRTWTDQGPLTTALRHPGHLLQLKDGRILLTFGMRDIYGVGIRVSEDEGETWSDTEVLVPLEKSDLGYPSTVELDDGTLVTAYYCSRVAQHRRYHMGVVRWSLDAA